jgi:hypothetical protein
MEKIQFFTIFIPKGIFYIDLKLTSCLRDPNRGKSNQVYKYTRKKKKKSRRYVE